MCVLLPANWYCKRSFVSLFVADNATKQNFITLYVFNFVLSRKYIARFKAPLIFAPPTQILLNLDERKSE